MTTLAKRGLVHFLVCSIIRSSRPSCYTHLSTVPHASSCRYTIGSLCISLAFPSHFRMRSSILYVTLNPCVTPRVSGDCPIMSPVTPCVPFAYPCALKRAFPDAFPDGFPAGIQLLISRLFFHARNVMHCNDSA